MPSSGSERLNVGGGWVTTYDGWTRWTSIDGLRKGEQEWLWGEEMGELLGPMDHAEFKLCGDIFVIVSQGMSHLRVCMGHIPRTLLLFSHCFVLSVYIALNARIETA